MLCWVAETQPCQVDVLTGFNAVSSFHHPQQERFTGNTGGTEAHICSRSVVCVCVFGERKGVDVWRLFLSVTVLVCTHFVHFCLGGLCAVGAPRAGYCMLEMDGVFHA